MKKLMVLGATFTQVPLIETAKRMGYHTIVASILGDYPGLRCADEICDVDISNPDAVLAKAKELNIDGIATCCMDLPVRALGKVCENMGLCGMSENAALLSNQKLLMKDAFVKGGVKSPAYRKVSTIADVEKTWAELPHPQILKAVDLQASRGIYVCNTLDELKNAFNEAMQLTREDFCIVEQFVKGIDIGAQAFVYNGEILFILPHNDEVYAGSANKPIGHSAPLLATDKVYKQTLEQCELAIRAMGLDNCAVNIDLIKTDDDEVYMIELTGRVGATGLPELVSLYYGINYYEMIVKTALGEDPRDIFNNRPEKVTPNASRFITSNANGILKQLINNNTPSDDIAMMDIFVSPGDKIRKFEDGKDRLGQVIVTGETLAKCFSRLDEIENNFTVEFAD